MNDLNSTIATPVLGIRLGQVGRLRAAHARRCHSTRIIHYFRQYGGNRRRLLAREAEVVGKSQRAHRLIVGVTDQARFARQTVTLVEAFEALCFRVVQDLEAAMNAF
jgi:hypothetical protein